MQPDTIIPSLSNPQGWNRYSYVLDNPLKYTDPSGHKYCLKDEKCDDHILSGSGKDFFRDYKSYSSWERNVLRNLYEKGGADGVHAVDYILQNDVHLVFNPETQPAAWHLFSNDIYLDSDQYNEHSDTADPYLLSLVAHEAIHLEQGPLKAISVRGEAEAWQVGFRIFETITGQLPSGVDPSAANNIMAVDTQNMNLGDIEDVRGWMQDFDPSYRSDLLFPNSSLIVYLPLPFMPMTSP